MNRRKWIAISGAALAGGGCTRPTHSRQRAAEEPIPDTPDRFLLKDYRPQSIYRVPKTEIRRAKFPAIDAHSHGAVPPHQLDEMIALMDAAGIEKAVILTGAATPERFGEVRQPYRKYPGRFDLWCGLDLRGAAEQGFASNILRPLEQCRRLGAAGVGEIIDKGRGVESYDGVAGTSTMAQDLHPDDARLDLLWDRCGRLGLPVSIHVSDPIWSYQPMDRTNDGLMNGYTWRIKPVPGMLGHDELIGSLEKTVKKHPRTIFIACHLLNLDYDLARLGQIFDRNPNLYADTGARYAEISPIPKAAGQFLDKYQDRVLYGTDLTYSELMLHTTFRILESQDEHFYVREMFNYHWPLYGLGLPAPVLKKVYGENARRAFERARGNAA